MGKIISYSNQKGRRPERRRPASIWRRISRRRAKRVLLIDLDPQGNATTGLGCQKSSLKKSVYNVIIEGEPVRDNVLETVLPNLFILPANIDLAGAEVDLVYKKNRDKVLRVALETREERVRLSAHRLPSPLWDF